MGVTQNQGYWYHINNNTLPVQNIHNTAFMCILEFNHQYTTSWSTFLRVKIHVQVTSHPLFHSYIYILDSTTVGPNFPLPQLDTSWCCLIPTALSFNSTSQLLVLSPHPSISNSPTVIIITVCVEDTLDARRLKVAFVAQRILVGNGLWVQYLRRQCVWLFFFT